MEKMEGWGIVIFLIILFAIFGGGNFFGNGNGRDGNYSNNNVGTRDLLDSMFAGFKGVGEQANANFYATNQNINRVGEKVDYYAYEGLKDQLAQTRDALLYEKQSREMERCCCALNSRLDSIECQMLKRPQLFGVASTCTGQLIPPIPTPAT